MNVDGRPEVRGGLADRYHELMGFRQEAFERYRANDISVVAGPPVRVTFPSFGFRDQGMKHKRFGPLYVSDSPPMFSIVDRIFRERAKPFTILEIGPGRGDLARHIRGKFGNKVNAYYGLDRDETVIGPWTVLEDISETPDGIDLVLASEVIEHMPADVWQTSIVEPLRQKLTRDAIFIASTPNPTSPGGIARDFTHVQHYPWYDLAAVFRLTFSDVEVYRTYYAYDPTHLLIMAPRFILCFLLGIEWCPGLICVARNAR